MVFFNPKWSLNFSLHNSLFDFAWLLNSRRTNIRKKQTKKLKHLTTRNNSLQQIFCSSCIISCHCIFVIITQLPKFKSYHGIKFSNAFQLLHLHYWKRDSVLEQSWLSFSLPLSICFYSLMRISLNKATFVCA